MSDVIAFARGVPAPEMLPVEELRACAARVLEHDAVRVLSYGGGAGWPALVELLAERHGVAPSRVVATTGSLQGFALLVEVLVERARSEGREPVVVVERPTYDRPLLLLERLGVRVVAVDVGPRGVDVAAFERVIVAERPLMAYLVPTFQNPSGATLPETDRARLLAAAARAGVPVLEDDPYRLLHIDEPPPPTLFGRDHGATVWYSGSCSKIVAPGLRAGWVVLDEELATAVATRANDTYISPVLLGHAIAAAHLASAGFEPSLERIRAQLARRRDAICEALARHLPEASFAVPGGGYFLWLRLPGDLDAREVARAAADRGVTFVPGAAFGADLERYLRLAYSSPPLELLEEGIRRLATACADVARGRASAAR